MRGDIKMSPIFFYKFHKKQLITPAITSAVKIIIQRYNHFIKNEGGTPV